jgi:hypothetical protein
MGLLGKNMAWSLKMKEVGALHATPYYRCSDNSAGGGFSDVLIIS